MKRRSILRPSVCSLVLAAGVAVGALSAQKPRTIVPIAPRALVVEDAANPQDGEPPDLGVRAQLIESPNLDRFLRRSQEFLDRRDFAKAITVLQDAIEGRVVQDEGGGVPQGVADPTAPAAPTGEGGEARSDDPFADEDNPGKAVYSADGRLYRPVLRLCHELLASMPSEGLELYRLRFEVEAERALAAAAAARDQAALEAIGRRFFATDAAARALDLYADLLLDAGRFKAAADTLRTLRTLHPRFREGEGLPGLTLLDIDLELALCHRLAGEPATTAAVLQEMEARYAGASVRIMGELVPVTALATHPAFAGGLAAPEPAPLPAAEAAADAPEFEEFDTIIPIWQRLFVESKPYATATATSRNTGFIIVADGGSGGAVPLSTLAQPGNSSVRLGDQLVYMEHNRLRVHDIASGRLLLEGDGEVDLYRLEAGQASPRISAYDYATMRPAADRERIYMVTVPARRLPGTAPVLENRLVALDRVTLQPAWMLGHGANDEDFRAVTFLATPTVFHDRLLVPVLVRGVYSLQCIDARTGASLFRTSLHSNGTELVRAPGAHVVVDRGTAFMLTNAGVLAALDAYSGVVRWLRRYERLDPFREHRLPRTSSARQPRFGVTMTTASSLPGFQFPSEILTWRGRLLVAPTDGRCLLCIDGATGEVEWLVGMQAREFDYLLGMDDEHVYLAGARLLCIELRTGIKLWDVDVPEHSQGRGCVTNGYVVLPGERRLHLLKTTGNASWQVRELPRFLQGQEGLATRPNLMLSGPYVVATHAGGVEVFGLVDGLRELAAKAESSLERARLLQHAGDLAGALDTLGRALESGDVPAADRAPMVREALPLAHEVALAMAVVQQREPALALLERSRAWLTHKADIESWHLARYEVLQALNDTGAALAELEKLRTFAARGQ